MNLIEQMNEKVNHLYKELDKYQNLTEYDKGFIDGIKLAIEAYKEVVNELSAEKELEKLIDECVKDILK